jgi:phage gpG-like protein
MMVDVLDAIGRRMADPELLDVLGSAAESMIIKNIKTGSWAANAPLTQDVKGNDKPLQDSGGFLGSFAHRVEGNKAIVGTTHVAARILNYGGTIRPKAAKNIAIPASHDTRTIMRMYGLTPRACIEGMKAAGYQIWISGACIMARKGKTGKPRALFLLRKSVTIPARHYMEFSPEGRTVLSRMAAKRIFG